jgi:hypothetical protein
MQCVSSLLQKICSVIDRDANGGIAGVDTGIIECHPHRMVAVCSINNNEITLVPVVTAGAAARSQRGDVVLTMMRQHACCPQQGRSPPFILHEDWNLLPIMSTTSC